MRRIFQKELDMILHWNLTLVGGFLGTYAILLHAGILVPHRPEMSWRWRRHLPEKILQKWGYDF